jgi:hypothetical protein
MAGDVNKINSQRAVVAPKASEKPPAQPGKPEATAVSTVDVASFRNLPLAGAPQVSAEVDETLGKTGLVPFLLNKIDGLGKIGPAISNGFRFLTRVVGPAAYWASTVRNFKLLFKANDDPTLNGKSKWTLALGTVGTGVAAAAATVAALPAKLAGMVGLTARGQINANKISGITGGIAGMAYATINMIETLRKKDAKPAERFFSKIGFGLGAIGFLFGTTALAISSGFGPAAVLAKGLPWLLPVASKVATVAGIAGMASWISQMIFGKNRWLNEKLKGSVVA